MNKKKKKKKQKKKKNWSGSPLVSIILTWKIEHSNQFPQLWKLPIT